jgi:hypothetical protein
MKVEGCEDAKADWEKGWAWAQYDPEKTNPEDLVKAINENTAFEAKLPEKSKKKEKDDSDSHSFRIDLYYNRTMVLLYRIDPEDIDPALTPVA